MVTPARSRVFAAYLMISEPYWVRASVLSYYSAVEHIVVSYDETFTSWSGQPLNLDPVLTLLESLDRDRKMEFLPGAYFRPELPLMRQETAQRQTCLSATSGADWVLQLDTDEIVPDMARLTTAVGHAEAAGRVAIGYPSRWIYAHVGGDRYLERCTRFWRRSASYPGALIVKPEVTLTVARQTDAPLWRADIRGNNTDPSHDRHTRVDETVPYASAVQHFSWVRPESELRAKGRVSGHTDTLDYESAIDLWSRRQRHPRLSCLSTPLPRRPYGQRLRLSRIPDAPSML